LKNKLNIKKWFAGKITHKIKYSIVFGCSLRSVATLLQVFDLNVGLQMTAICRAVERSFF